MRLLVAFVVVLVLVTGLPIASSGDAAVAHACAAATCSSHPPAVAASSPVMEPGSPLLGAVARDPKSMLSAGSSRRLERPPRSLLFA